MTLASLAGCSAPSSNGPASGSAELAAPASTCVSPSREADPATGHYPPLADSISIAGDLVSLCWGAKRPERTCWRVDVTRARFEARPVTSDADPDAPRFARPPRAKAELRDDGSIRLCKAGGNPCRTFANPGPTDRPVFVGVDDNLSLVAIPDDETLRIYDVASARVRTTIKAWPSDMAGFHSAPLFIGDRLVVWYGATPVSEHGRIFDLAGKQLAVIGGEDFHVLTETSLSSFHIHGTEWAFKDEANRLVLVDIADPKVTSMHDTKALLVTSPRPSPGNDFGIADVLAVAGTAARLIIVTGENPFTIGVLDRRTGRLEKLEPPRCSTSS